MATLCLVAALLGFVALPAMHLAEHASSLSTHQHHVDGGTRRRARSLQHAHDGKTHSHSLTLADSSQPQRNDGHDEPSTPPDDHGDGGLAHLSALLVATAAPPLAPPVEPAARVPLSTPRNLLAQRPPSREGSPRGPPPQHA